MAHGTTMGEQIEAIMAEIHDNLLCTPSLEKIDWTNLKALLAQFIQQFAPILIPIIIGWLTPKTEG